MAEMEELLERQTASGAILADGCWSCDHYANHGGNTNGTPPWPTCAFRLAHPGCGRWKLAVDQPWRFDFGWRAPAPNKKDQA